MITAVCFAFVYFVGRLLLYIIERPFLRPRDAPHVQCMRPIRTYLIFFACHVGRHPGSGRALADHSRKLKVQHSSPSRFITAKSAYTIRHHLFSHQHNTTFSSKCPVNVEELPPAVLRLLQQGPRRPPHLQLDKLLPPPRLLSMLLLLRRPLRLLLLRARDPVYSDRWLRPLRKYKYLL